MKLTPLAYAKIMYVTNYYRTRYRIDSDNFTYETTLSYSF